MHINLTHKTIILYSIPLSRGLARGWSIAGILNATVPQDTSLSATERCLCLNAVSRVTRQVYKSSTQRPEAGSHFLLLSFESLLPIKMSVISQNEITPFLSKVQKSYPLIFLLSP